MKKIVLFTAFVMLCFNGFGQVIPRFNPDTIKTIQLDSAVNITSERLSVETFIRAVTTDTSFYQAFRNMKKYSFVAENSIYTYDKKNKVTGRLYRKVKRNNAAPWLEYLVKQDTGKLFKKNGKYNLYTVEMFDYIFMNAYQSSYSSESAVGKSDGAIAGYKDKLKTLIFSPGRPVKGLPFIGSKTEIFTANMRQYYDYSFFSGTYLDSIPVYRFKVTVKPDLSNWTKDGLMIKELTTIFDKRNFEILGRYVDMKYSNMLFDFNVQMNIEMGYFGEEKLPAKVSYQGNWNVPMKKPEKASVLVLQRDYRLGKGK
ncbi:hypothetical protein FBD94_15300 [Pedobacter hiemivivus]|uniref:Uncharacterized protein n=1 Tax=Pedobacter hiemivivus TaxID=2530454 RepID=A0A4R0NDE3_9SPHI|nr:hypothetical protein [Pedobacter hiemivivus]TCC97727.1 hypothetical protein EZ444_07385 [Pedobacter hiemivivus]TKC60272.1 hypothetical protein FBD94_15300 [Pedobacter hiemivivus]